MTWEPAAVTAYETWLFAGTPPVPEHPKLTYYNGRRPMHLQKLCMVASAARCSDRRVVLEDYRNALNWLLEAEAMMPEIFLAMAASSDSDVMNDVYAWMLQQYGKMDRPIPKHMMFNFIRERVPFHTVPKILSIMVQSRVAEVIEIEGQLCYKPNPKAEHRKI